MPTENKSVIIPALRYENAPAAIDFLCDAFGFTRHAVYADDTDKTLIHHAQLTLNGSMIMLGSARPGEAQELYGMKTAQQAGGVTVTIYVVVDDPEAHHARAAAAAADIVRPPYDNDGYPGRSYTARDTGGNVWNFGSYDPYA